MIPELAIFTSLRDRLGDDLLRIFPELILCLTIVVMLVLRMFRAESRIPMSSLAILGCLVSAVVLIIQWTGFSDVIRGGPAFDQLLTIDPLAVAFRFLILLTAILVLVLGRLTGLPDPDDSADYATLLLGATLGMMLMVSANHFLMVFLAIEMASLPSYVLVGFLKGRPKSSEASLKYVIFGAAASGIMLYGISLLAGRFGTGLLSEISQQVAQAIQEQGFDLPLVTSLLFILVGLGYKISAVPFHVWLPDAFEGAAAEIGAFLSVASKAAAFGLLIRFALNLQTAVSNLQPDSLALAKSVGVGLLITAMITCTVGNLAAFGQTNVKRMLGYSTIAHAGYMLMAVAPLSASGASAVLVYLAAYLPMNLGAFAVVAFVRNRTGSEELSSFRGLMARTPAVGIAWAVFLFGLLGLPPLAGFAGKFLAFSAVYDAGRTFFPVDANLGTWYYIALGVGVLNTAVSAGYYLKLLRLAGFEEAVEQSDRVDPPAAGGFVLLLSLALIVLGVWWAPLLSFARFATLGFSGP